MVPHRETEKLKQHLLVFKEVKVTVRFIQKIQISFKKQVVSSKKLNFKKNLNKKNMLKHHVHFALFNEFKITQGKYDLLDFNYITNLIFITEYIAKFLFIKVKIRLTAATCK